MKEGLRSIIAASSISAGCLCIWFGSNMRDRVDVGTSQLSSSNSSALLSTWVASRDNQVNVPAVDYYSQMVSLLKKYYVEPIKSDDKLADGAVRGMIGSLGDPQSLFMDPKAFQAYRQREKGVYEGIGVDLALDLGGKRDKSSQAGIQPAPADAEEAVAMLSRFPRVVVTAVVPGGPADKAGVQIGDVVADIDGHWVVDEALLDRFKKAQHDFNDKKLTYSQIEPLRDELRQKTKRALLPVRTLDKLLVGLGSDVTVTWKRGTAIRSTRITKAVCRMPEFEAKEGKIVLPMTDSSVNALKAALVGKKEVTLDLRNDPEGSFTAMLGCLQLLAPAGRYGVIANQRPEDSTPLSVLNGNAHPPKIRLLVGRGTRGPAEILALALSAQGRATLIGQETGGDLSVRQDVELPSGAGYDLVIGSFRSGSSKVSGPSNNALAKSKLKNSLVAKSEGKTLSEAKEASAVQLESPESLLHGGVR